MNYFFYYINIIIISYLNVYNNCFLYIAFSKRKFFSISIFFLNNILSFFVSPRGNGEENNRTSIE